MSSRQVLALEPIFGQPSPLPLSAKLEEMCIGIAATDKVIANDFRCDQTVSDAVATVSKGKIGMRQPRIFADVGQAILGCSKSTCPRIGDLQFNLRKKSREFASQN